MPTSVETLCSYIESSKKRSEFWHFGNDVLYEMCRKNFDHQDVTVITGKLMLIGRTYSATLDRQTTKVKGQTREIVRGRRLYAEVSEKIRDSDLDQRLKALQGYLHFEPSIKQELLSIHIDLVSIFRDVTGQEKTSLASKYLHFHLQDLFFIMDSLAKSALAQITIQKPRGGYGKYPAFFNAMSILQAQIHECCGEIMTPRELDDLLYRVLEIA